MHNVIHDMAGSPSSLGKTGADGAFHRLARIERIVHRRNYKEQQQKKHSRIGNPHIYAIFRRRL